MVGHPNAQRTIQTISAYQQARRLLASFFFWCFVYPRLREMIADSGQMCVTLCTKTSVQRACKCGYCGKSLSTKQRVQTHELAIHAGEEENERRRAVQQNRRTCAFRRVLAFVVPAPPPQAAAATTTAAAALLCRAQQFLHPTHSRWKPATHVVIHYSRATHDRHTCT